MRQKTITTNTFTLGMRQDRTVYAQDKRSYREAYNGNIVFSGSGDAQFCNEPGNYQLENTFPADYYEVGSRELRDFTIIFSTNDVNSEIGMLTLTADGAIDGGEGKYTTLFNDEFDPNGDLLGFSLGHLILPAEQTYEDIQKQRVYWLQDNKEPRCFNVKVGLVANSPEFVDGSYTPLSLTGVYPWFYSVHSMSMQADFSMGRLKLKDTTATDGSLKTGMYEMSYRLVTRDGYNTPWFPLTKHFFVTIQDAPDVAGSSYHARSMYASNVMTNKSYTFTVEDVDTRFYQLEVAYVYSTDKDVTVEASIFYREKIDPLVADVDVIFNSTTGIAVSLAEFNRYIIPIRRAQAIGQKDNRLWIGGPETYGPYELDLSAVTIAPYIKEMAVDELEDVIEEPFTYMSQTNTAQTVQSYLNNVGAAVNESHDITSDYPNYKGVQYEHLNASYWGGETYPFSLLVFDLKGNPFYAQHIRDYTFPERYDDPSYQLMTTVGSINLLGVKFSGIDITDILFDAAGKLQVSGVAIVRSKRVPRILCQGVLLPGIIENDPLLTNPMPVVSGDAHGANAGLTDSVQYVAGTSNGQQMNTRPYTAMFYSPDILFERNIWEGTSQDTVIEDVDQLEIVSLYKNSYIIGEYDAVEIDGGMVKLYTKMYDINDEPQLIEYGKVSRIKKLLQVETFIQQDTEWEAYDEDDTTLEFSNSTNFDGYGITCINQRFATGVRDAWLLKTKDIKTVTYYTGGTPQGKSRYYIANYIVNQPKYFTAPDQKSLSERLSIGTGHFQPINAAVLASILSGGRYILNGVEVWGGDCYPWNFDFVRLYPQYSGGCNDEGGCWTDYGVAVIVPLESTMNMALRRGRNFAGKGIRSEIEACGGTDLFPDGISVGQPEEFYLNSVVMHEGNVQAFISKPDIIDPDITLFDYRWIHSNLKIFGEITDQYRTFLSNNFGDMEPNYGKIIGRGYFSDYMYCLQERGMSRLRINELRAITTQMGEPISTGVTDIWQKPEMISRKHGTLSAHSIIQTDRGFYFADYFNKCFNRFAQDGLTNLSEDGEMKEWSDSVLKYMDKESTLNPLSLRHIAGGWDSKRDMLYWSLQAHDLAPLFDDVTLAYSANRHVHANTTFHDWAADVYGNCKGFTLLTSYQADANHMYVHYKGDRGYYFGNYHKTKITFICNDAPDVDKLWDNAWASFNADAFTILENIYWETENQAMSMALAGDVRSEYRNLIFRNETVARPVVDNCDYLLNVGVPVFPLANVTVIKNGVTVVLGGILNAAALQAYFVAEGFTNAYPIFTKLQTPDVWTSIDWTGLGAPILFTKSNCISPAAPHLSGKYLQTQYVFQNAANKVIAFTSHDQSFRLIAKVR